MVDRTLHFVFDHDRFKTLGGSRTDAMVSANHFVLELFTKEEIGHEGSFVEKFNINLPSDIKCLAIEKTDSTFNIIQNPKSKEYLYLFSFGEKAHPFSAPFITTIPDKLDVPLMKEGAKVFEGTHEYRAYCKKPKENTTTQRTVNKCELVDNTFYTASFFPTPSYAVVFQSQGFMRNQIRIMMGELFRLGKGEISIDELKNSLSSDFDQHLTHVAPASGLLLNKVSFS